MSAPNISGSTADAAQDYSVLDPAFDPTFPLANSKNISGVNDDLASDYSIGGTAPVPIGVVVVSNIQQCSLGNCVAAGTYRITLVNPTPAQIESAQSTVNQTAYQAALQMPVTFTNSTPITIDNAHTPATYNLTVANVPGTVKKATVTVTALTYNNNQATCDLLIDILMPRGSNPVLMLAGVSSGPVVSQTLVFDDTAGAPLGAGPIVSGTYQSNSGNMGAINGLSGNGTWSLFINNSDLGFVGTITSWSVTLISY